MHIVVCIKQTPATSNIQIDPKTGTLKREGMAAAINPFDEYAIEEAVRIKERVPGTIVSIVTMGPPQAEEALRDAIARGADQAFHLCDRAFAGADTWATSYALQMGIRKIAESTGKPVDLIICGKQTNDGDTGHVGPGIAAWLNIPNVAYVKKVDQIDDKKIVVWRMMEDGTDVLEMPLPALIAVVKGTSFTDTGLGAAKTYSYAVSAYDAAGNTSASVMGPTYPGAGGTIGPALVFGFLAAEASVADAASRGGRLLANAGSA